MSATAWMYPWATSLVLGGLACREYGVMVRITGNLPGAGVTPSLDGSPSDTAIRTPSLIGT